MASKTAVVSEDPATRTRSTRSKGQATRKPSGQTPASPTRARPYPDAKSRSAGGAKRGRPRKNTKKTPPVEEAQDSELEPEDQTGEAYGHAYHDDDAAGEDDIGEQDVDQGDQNHPQGGVYPHPDDAVQSHYYQQPGDPQTYGAPPGSIQSSQQTLASDGPRQPTGSLHSLADGPEGHNARPPYPYSTLIRYAIEGSPRGKLTLAELYTAIEKRFPWFSRSGSGWKNSIRHNLSLNKTFVKVARPLTEPGKGSYWSINLNAVNEPDADHPAGGRDHHRSASDGGDAGPSNTGEPAEKKRRGRARKPPLEVPDISKIGIVGLTHNDQHLHGNGYMPHPYDPHGGYNSGEHSGVSNGPPPAPEPKYIWNGYGQRTLVVPQPPPPPTEEHGYNNAGGHVYQQPHDQGAPGHYEHEHHPGHYVHVHGHPQPQMHHPGGVGGYIGGAPPEGGYFTAAGAAASVSGGQMPFNAGTTPTRIPTGEEFTDDRPDRNAPRTIYNHSGAVAAFAGPPAGMYAPPPYGGQPPPPPQQMGGYPADMYARYEYPATLMAQGQVDGNGVPPHMQAPEMGGDERGYGPQ